MAHERVSELEVKVTTPFTDEDVEALKIGDHVLLTGTIYTARDAAHNRMIQTLDAGGELPFDLKGQLIYYVGPTPTRPGHVAGAVGPTTSMRMDPFTPRLLAEGLKACMGKGNRGPEVQAALKEHHAVYLMAVGGAGAMLSQFVKKIEVIAYEDLGTESIKRMEVKCKLTQTKDTAPKKQPSSLVKKSKPWLAGVRKNEDRHTLKTGVVSHTAGRTSLRTLMRAGSIRRHNGGGPHNEVFDPRVFRRLS